MLIAYIDREQRYQFNNRAFNTWFGLDLEAIRGRTMRSVLGERLYERIAPYVKRALAGEQTRFAIEFTLDGGRYVAVEGMYVPDRAEDGEIRGFYALIMDVTARNRAQHQASQLRVELVHAGRVSLMGVLAAALAHELNQPLTAIMSNAQAARRFLNAPAPNLQEIGEILEDIALDDERASEVIQRLRALVKKKPTDFQMLDVADMIRGVERLVHSDATIRQMTVCLDVEPGLPPVRGDRVQLQQVLLNLLINAFDASEGSAAEDRIVTIDARQHQGQVMIHVRDRGTGIGQDVQLRLFEPFQTSKQQGLGMGLSISKSIVELHGGRLWAENNPDRGATFCLALPVDPGEAAAEDKSEGVARVEPVAESLRGG